MTPCSARFMIAPSIRPRSPSPRNIVCAAPSATVRPRAPAPARYGIFAGPLPILVSMTGHATPPELPPGLLEEYLAGMRPVLVALVGLAERLAAARNDLAALEALPRETHKIHGPPGSFGFMEVPRPPAGMQAPVKDWIPGPGAPEVDPGAPGARGRRARDRVRGRRRGARGAARVRPQHARLPVRGVPQRP